MSASDAQATKQRVIIILGPPGSGKSTLAEELSKKKMLPHISSGNLFYEHLKNNTELGQHVKMYLDKGLLVPDDLVLDIMYDRIFMPDCANGYILDGIPKNIAQIHELEDNLRGKAIVVAVNLALSDEVAITRLSGRMICQKCGHVWHTEISAPKEPGICDLCSGELKQRSDDTPEAIKERLKVYHAQTKALEQFYKDAGQLLEIDASKPADQVLADLMLLTP